MADDNNNPCASTERLQLRVKSFTSDPLHSAAYLVNLRSYLAGKFSRQSRVSRDTAAPPPPQVGRGFLYSYKISGTDQPKPIIYKEVTDLIAAASNSRYSEIVFATGYQSQEWLNAIVDHFAVDYRFLHSHLDFLPSAQRDWYINPNVPSRRQHFVRLVVPSIVFFDTEARRIPAKDLHNARNACNTQLQQQAKSFFGGSASQHGESIVRKVNIHSGDMMVLEQALTITVTKHSANVQVIVWSDAGDHYSAVPFPDTPRYHAISQTMEFCPVFFEKHVQCGKDVADPKVNINIVPRTRQPLAVLPLRYGETMDWSQITDDPLVVLQELFHFQSSASAQYLNMLRELTTETIARTPPTGEALPTMDDILHFDYTKATLSRWCAHFKTLSDCLDDDLLIADTNPSSQTKHDRVKTSLRKDLEFLIKEAELLIDLCESGKATIMSSFTVYESKEAAAESKLVTQLTKATNRITFIFLPISFVTSVFGMNFKQLGQGSLSITMWITVTLPLLAVCILLNECGSWLARCGRAVFLSPKKT